MGEEESGKPLVSFCIPTYNRCACLMNCIRSITEQKGYDPRFVEIVVSDNCSSDGTREAMERVSSSRPGILYSRNETNEEDFNFPTVLTRAHGLFRKLLNDTVVLKDGALPLILNLIREKQEERPVLFFCNSEEGNAVSLRSTDSPDAFLRMVSYRMNWIGGLGIWEEDLARIDTSRKACETKLWQVEAVLENLGLKKSYAAVGTTLMLTQVQFRKKRDYDVFGIFYTNYLALIESHRESLSLDPATVAWLKHDLVFGFFARFVAEYRCAVKNIEDPTDVDELVARIAGTLAKKEARAFLRKAGGLTRSYRRRSFLRRAVSRVLGLDLKPGDSLKKKMREKFRL